MMYLTLALNIFNVILNLTILYYFYINNIECGQKSMMSNNYERLQTDETIEEGIDNNDDIIKNKEIVVVDEKENSITDVEVNIADNKEDNVEEVKKLGDITELENNIELELEDDIEMQDSAIEDKEDELLIISNRNTKDVALHSTQILELSSGGFEINKRRKLALKLSGMNDNSSM